MCQLINDEINHVMEHLHLILFMSITHRSFLNIGVRLLSFHHPGKAQWKVSDPFLHVFSTTEIFYYTKTLFCEHTVMSLPPHSTFTCFPCPLFQTGNSMSGCLICTQDSHQSLTCEVNSHYRLCILSEKGGQTQPTITGQ